MNNTYLILGDEVFQKEKINEIIKQITVQPENIEIINSEEKSWYAIADDVKTYSLFGIPRLFIIQNADVFKGEEKIEDIINNALNYYLSNDLIRAGKEVLKAIRNLELTEEELLNIKESPSLLNNYFSQYTENTSFLTEIVKKGFINPEKIKRDDTVNFSELISSIPEGHYLIITAKEYDKRTKNFKIFQKSSQIFEKEEIKLSSKDIKKRIQLEVERFIRSNNKKISSEDLIYLSEKATESPDYKAKLEKLILLVGDSHTISKEEIDNTFDDDISPDSQLIPEFIRKRDISSAVKIVLNQRNTKQDFIKLTGYLRSLMRNAIAIREFSDEAEYNDYYDFDRRFYKKYLDTLPKETLKNQHPYYLFQCYLTFKDFQIEHLRKMYKLLFEIDRKLKTTQTNPSDLFLDFISSLFTTRN